MSYEELSAAPVFKFRVAICGGGIGGVVLAIALTKYPDVAIDIYEAAPKFEELGYGITIWGTGRTVLQKLGMEEKLAPIAGAPPNDLNQTSFTMRRSDLPIGRDLGKFTMSHSLGFHRGRLLGTLLSVVSSSGRANIHFGKRCVSFTERDEGSDGSVTLQFADGTSAACDVLVGADGIKSVVRGELLRKSADVRNEEIYEAGRHAGTTFSGTVVYRALLKSDDVTAAVGTHRATNDYTMYCGREKHLVAYPVGGAFINLLGYCSSADKQEEWKRGPWEIESHPKELIEQFQDWEPEVQALTKCVDKTTRWAVHDVEPMPFWSIGHVTLLGDAAHAMPPFLGSGGGQTVEDAYVLGHLLGSHLATRENLPSILRAYETVRRVRATKTLLSTHRAGQIQDFKGKYENLEDNEVAQALNQEARWLWEGEHDPNEDLRMAESLLRQ